MNGIEPAGGRKQERIKARNSESKLQKQKEKERERERMGAGERR